jgi:pyruvate/2-oxoglutarate dehydrogenase complex dihydrolipoamide dehydrogenase (E3) component
LERLGPADSMHAMHTMTDTFALTTQLARQPETALIVGAGYIGLEMAEASTTRGRQVTAWSNCRRCWPPWIRRWPSWSPMN